MRGSRRRACLVAAVGLVALATGSVSDAWARPKVFRAVPTKVTLSATKAADGTVTVNAAYTSSDPRCLSGKRFLQKHKDGNYWVVGGYLSYGGPFTSGALSQPFGADGTVTPPNKGLMAPASPAGKSPFLWQAVWPGATPAQATNFNNPSLPRHYYTTVSAATGVSLTATARASMGQGLPYFKVAFNQGGKHIVIKCGTLPKSSSTAQIAF